MHFRGLSHAYAISGLSTRSYLVSWCESMMSMQENVQVCVVLGTFSMSIVKYTVKKESTGLPWLIGYNRLTDR